MPHHRLTDAGVHDERDGDRVAVTAQNPLDRTSVSGFCGLDHRFCGDRRRITASPSYQVIHDGAVQRGPALAGPRSSC